MKISLIIEATDTADIARLRALLDEMGGLTVTGDGSVVDMGRTIPSMTGLSPTVAPEPDAPRVETTVAPHFDTPLNTDIGDIDSRGVPYSAEHHAKTKTTIKSGAWKSLKGGDKAALTAYEAPFLSAPQPDTVAPAPIVPEAVAPAPTPQPEVVAPAPIAPPVTIAPPATDNVGILTARLSDIVAQQTPAANLAPWGTGWENFHTMTTTDAVNMLCTAFGVDGFGGIAQCDEPTLAKISEAVSFAWPA